MIEKAQNKKNKIKAVKATVAEKKKAVAAKAKKINPNAVTTNRLKLLITTVNRAKGDYYADLVQSFDVNMQVLALAKGTANAKMLDIHGLADTSKTVIFSIIQESKVPEAMRTLEEKFSTIKDGKGIAFTVPLSSVIGTLIFGFLSNNKKAVKETKL